MQSPRKSRTDEVTAEESHGLAPDGITVVSDVAKPPRLSTRSTSFGQAVRSKVPQIGKEVRLLGCMSFFTMIVIVGMSIYVVNNTEFRFNENNAKLLANDGRTTMITAKEEYEISDLQAIVHSKDDSVRNIEDLTFIALAPNGELMQVMMHVDRVVRYSSGVMKLCSSDHACIVAFASTDGSVGANYTDTDDCATAPGCHVVVGPNDPELLSRSNATAGHGHGRRMHWNWWFHSHASGSSPSSPSPSPTCSPSSAAPSIFCRTAVMNNCNCQFDSSGAWTGCSTEYHYCSSWNFFCWGVCGQHDKVRYESYCGVQQDCSSATPSGRRERRLAEGLAAAGLV